jgi:hypothetical protein
MARLKGLFGLLLMVVISYVLWQVVPPIFNNYQFEDIITTEARLGSYSTKSEQDIQAIVFQKSHELEIPITREQIKVERIDRTINISAPYTVHIDLPIYPFDLNFNPSTRNKGL